VRSDGLNNGECSCGLADRSYARDCTHLHKLKSRDAQRSVDGKVVVIKPASATPRRRLARADQHIAQLHIELEPYMHRLARARVRVEKRIEFRPFRVLAATWTLLDFEPAPDNWPLLLGDAFHNLRSALDNAAWWATNGARDSMSERDMRRIAYPICLTSESFEQHVVAVALPAPQRAALRAQQPFVVTPDDPARDALWALLQLSNLDKHRELTIPAAILRAAHLQTTPPIDGGTLTTPAPDALSPGDTLAEFVVPWSADVNQLRVELTYAIEALVQGDDWRGAVPLQLGVNEIRNRVDAALSALGM